MDAFLDDHIPHLIIPLVRCTFWFPPPEDRILVVGIRWLNPILRDKCCCDLTVTSLGMMVRSSVTIPKWPWVVEFVFIQLEIFIWWLNPIHSHTTVSIHFLVLGCYCQRSWNGDSNPKNRVYQLMYLENINNFFLRQWWLSLRFWTKQHESFLGFRQFPHQLLLLERSFYPAAFPSICFRKEPHTIWKKNSKVGWWMLVSQHFRCFFRMKTAAGGQEKGSPGGHRRLGPRLPGLGESPVEWIQSRLGEVQWLGSLGGLWDLWNSRWGWNKWVWTWKCWVY